MEDVGTTRRVGRSVGLGERVQAEAVGRRGCHRDRCIAGPAARRRRRARSGCAPKFGRSGSATGHGGNKAISYAPDGTERWKGDVRRRWPSGPAHRRRALHRVPRRLPGQPHAQLLGLNASHRRRHVVQTHHHRWGPRGPRPRCGLQPTPGRRRLLVCRQHQQAPRSGDLPLTHLLACTSTPRTREEVPSGGLGGEPTGGPTRRGRSMEGAQGSYPPSLETVT